MICDALAARVKLTSWFVSGSVGLAERTIATAFWIDTPVQLGRTRTPRISATTTPLALLIASPFLMPPLYADTPTTTDLLHTIEPLSAQLRVNDITTSSGSSSKRLVEGGKRKPEAPGVANLFHHPDYSLLKDSSRLIQGGRSDDVPAANGIFAPFR